MKKYDFYYIDEFNRNCVITFLGNNYSEVYKEFIECEYCLNSRIINIEIKCDCGQHLADSDNNNNLLLDSEIEYVFRHSTWNEVECPNCNKNNFIDGFIVLESFNKSTLEG